MKFDRCLLNDDTYLFLGYDKGQEIYCLRNIICIKIKGVLMVDASLLRVRKRSADSFDIKMVLHINSNNEIYQASYVSLEHPNKSIVVRDDDSHRKEYILALRNYIMEYNNIKLLRSE